MTLKVYDADNNPLTSWLAEPQINVVALAAWLKHVVRKASQRFGNKNVADLKPSRSALRSIFKS
jgi:hypothetical protein